MRFHCSGLIFSEESALDILKETIVVILICLHKVGKRKHAIEDLMPIHHRQSVCNCISCFCTCGPS